MSKNEQINTTISNEDYHANRSHVSSSGLKLYLKDPVEYHKQYVLGQSWDVPPALQNAFDFGTYVHAMVLEPHLLEEEFAIYESGCREAFDYDNQGKLIMTTGQDANARKMFNNYKKTVFHPEGKPISSFFEGGQAEESMFGELDGLKVKIRTDYRKVCKSGFASINDVKTTSKNVNFKNITKTCEELDYDLSAALYCDVAEQVTGIKHDFFFLFMGKKDYKSEIFRASEEFLERGRVKYKRAIKGIKKSRETGVWIPELG
jgi:exodeoxyribonuclease VIII